MEIKDVGIILRSTKYRDTSLILKAFTSSHGIVSLLARGVVGKKKTFVPELFKAGEVIFLQQAGRELCILKQWEALHSYDEPNLEQFYRNSVMAEVLLRTAEEGGGLMWEYELLAPCFSEDVQVAPSKILTLFLMRYLEMQGVGITTKACQQCGTVIENNAATMQLNSGHILCDVCSVHTYKRFKEICYYWNHLEDENMQAENTLIISAESLLLRYLSYHLHVRSPFKTYSSYKNLILMNNKE
jgi:DNA repair protein RecO